MFLFIFFISLILNRIKLHTGLSSAIYRERDWRFRYRSVGEMKRDLAPSFASQLANKTHTKKTIRKKIKNQAKNSFVYNKKKTSSIGSLQKLDYLTVKEIIYE